MIKELLIANEGYTQGFNNHKYVTDRVKNRTRINHLESFYTKHIHSKVNNPEDKIVDALKKSTIKFRLLIWPAPSLQKAAEAYDEATESDLEDYIEKEINKLEIKNVDKKTKIKEGWSSFYWISTLLIIIVLLNRFEILY